MRGPWCVSVNLRCLIEDLILSQIFICSPIEVWDSGLGSIPSSLPACRPRKPSPLGLWGKGVTIGITFGPRCFHIGTLSGP